MFRIILLLALVLFWFMQFYVGALVVFVYYLFRYTGFELVIIAALLDGYMGAFSSLPIIFLTTTVLWIVVDVIKTRLLLYTEQNEVIS
jgi:hypothetical protein